MKFLSSNETIAKTHFAIITLNFWQWMSAALLLSMTCTSIVITITTTNSLEFITYDIEKLSTNLKNSTTATLLRFDGEDGGIVRLIVNGTDGRRRNSTVMLLTEHIGIWSNCMHMSNYNRTWTSVMTNCNRYLESCVYFLKSNLEEHCCNDCYHKELVEDTEDGSLRVNEANKSQISSIIVCLTLHSVSWLLILIILLKRYVAVTFMTGITFMLGGLFFAFMLMVQHYAMEIVEKQRGKALVPLPKEVIAVRNINIGWGLPLGWVGVTLSILVCIVWIRLSYFMAANPIDSEYDYYEEHMKISKGKTRKISHAQINGNAHKD